MQFMKKLRVLKILDRKFYPNDFKYFINKIKLIQLEYTKI